MMLRGMSQEERNSLSIKNTPNEYSCTKTGTNIQLDNWDDSEEFGKENWLKNL